jgi:predicted SAM-dependent methyltransferase
MNTQIFNDDKKIVLNVGAGKTKLESFTSYFNDWKEVTVDIEEVEPDVVSDLRDLKEVPNESVDAVWACHVIEHMYYQDLPKVFGSIMRVLKKDGFCIVRVPDLASISHLITNNILKPVYITESGLEVTPLDMIYGHRMYSNGNDNESLAMLHKTGFTQQSLSQMLGDLNIKAFIKSRNHEVQCVIYKDQVPQFILDRKEIF